MSDSDPKWYTIDSTGKHTYDVTKDGDDEVTYEVNVLLRTCTCPDARFRGGAHRGWCKHRMMCTDKHFIVKEAKLEAAKAMKAVDDAEKNS